MQNNNNNNNIDVESLLVTQVVSNSKSFYHKIQEHQNILSSPNKPSVISLVPTPCAPPGEKRSGEWSQISWAYSTKRWKTNEIVRSLIIT